MARYSKLHMGKGYYPMPFSVAVDPAATLHRQQVALTRKAHQAGTGHHVTWCPICQRDQVAVCALCVQCSGITDTACLVGGPKAAPAKR